MMETLARPDVLAGFVTFSHSSKIATLGVRVDEDADVNSSINLLEFPRVPLLTSYQSSGDKLDQVFNVPAGLRIALLDCDLCMTKNLKKLRSTVVKEYGISMDEDKAYKNLSNE